PGDSGCFQEPIFIPRAPNAEEADGYVVSLLNLIAEGRSELVVLDSRDMESGPIARIKVPFRMRMSLHGCWVPSKK
uniref:carotenoid oxygenase family protein n=1 Tax=Pseudomonas sp. TaxID=306 RepID=UPI002623CD7A